MLMSLVLAGAIVLASAPLSLLISGADWLLLPLLSALVVGGLGALVRWREPRRLRALPVQLAGLVVLTVLVEIVTGALPGGGVLGAVTGQVGAVRQGVNVLLAAQAPLELAPTARIVLLLLVGLVVLALDVLCVEGHWYAVTAVVLLGFLLVPALMVPDGGGWLTVVGPVLGALVVLVVGSLPRPRERDTAEGGVRDRPSRRLAIGLMGAGVVALATPVASALLPRAKTPAFPVDLDRINAWQGRSGLMGGAMIDDSISVRRNLQQGAEREMLKLRTDAPDPGYLRLQSLTRFDGERFFAGNEHGPSSETTEPSYSDRKLEDSKPRDAATYDISITDMIGDRLPTPFPIRWSDADRVVQLAKNGTTDGELPISSGARDLSGLTYSVAVDPKTFSARALSSVSRDQMRIPYENGYLQVGSTPRIHELATEIARDAGSDVAYDVATALVDYFHENFEYSLTVTSSPGENPIDAFLSEGVGYCEQFAATFALVMNDLKFPTRVCIGFTAGDVDGDARTITNHHAHAWPETWFGTDHGWVRFEPTPAAANNGVATPTFAADTPDPDQSAEQTPTSDADSSTTPAEDATASQQETPDEESASSSDEATSSRASDGADAVVPWWGWGLGGLGLAGAALGGGALARSGVRRRALAAREQRWAALDPAEAADLAWNDLIRAVDYRARAIRLLGWTHLYGTDPAVLRFDRSLPPAAALETLLADAQEAGIEVPERAHMAAERIAGAVTRARYAPPAGASSAADTGRAAPDPEDSEGPEGPSALREAADQVRAVVLSRQ
ncbi:hypothetical protein DEO23_04890 [Brachybacterium endophyticum]|uniref:Transglutaminase-like domain-containing protein n=1 Tax=Brachybacterium endophyticum TaxID=2182385 RepID=A0A2U2RKJ0_9MICO|nr:hypothetical protein DEO23_04890 [Brachybacterium endophyticum]